MVLIFSFLGMGLSNLSPELIGRRNQMVVRPVEDSNPPTCVTSFVPPSSVSNRGGPTSSAKESRTSAVPLPKTRQKYKSAPFMVFGLGSKPIPNHPVAWTLI